MKVFSSENKTGRTASSSCCRAPGNLKAAWERHKEEVLRLTPAACLLLHGREWNRTPVGGTGRETFNGTPSTTHRAEDALWLLHHVQDVERDVAGLAAAIA